MKLTKLYLKIISKEPYNDMNVFFSGFESSDEIPLISRRHRLKLLQKSMESDKISDFLIGFSFFLMNSIKALSTTQEDNDTLFAVSFPDFDLLAEEGVLMPHIFVYPGADSTDFAAKIKAKQKYESSRELNVVKKHFARCNLGTIFDFYESRFHDSASGEDIIRIYALPKKLERKEGAP
ncbi:hypothetical protein [Pseudomonas sp. Ps21-P2]|uniref:hypothetical protein n=1 Tax=Pseudomonas sp. Ps21-P2 TaxID=3080331 RepID=UPI003207F09F